MWVNIKKKVNRSLKMKVGILTFHNADNCGAVLQAYALSECLKSAGCQAELIDYYCPEIEDGYKPSNRIRGNNPLKTVVKKMLFSKRVSRTYENFRLFRKENLSVSAKHYTSSNRNEIANDYDVVISGSDQVFDLKITGNDTTYFCDFIDNKSKKYTYAASAGEIPTEKEKIDKFVSLLSSFEVVSFREKSSLDFINRVCPQLKCHTNIDPVFLLKESDWNKLAVSSLHSPYVLYFPVQKPAALKAVLRTVRAIAGNKSATPVIASVAPCMLRAGFSNKGCESPSQFIGYMKNAEYIVTTSFHATAFAIIMHKNFFAEINIKKSSRISDLLELTGLSHRVMHDGVIGCKYEISEKEWKYADAQIEKERKKAFEYLKSIIEIKDDSNE